MKLGFIGYSWLLLLLCNNNNLLGQLPLNRLPRVEVKTLSPRQLSGIGPLMITTTPKSFFSKKDDLTDTFQVSIQIIDPLKPWPPIWYLAADDGLFYNAQLHPGAIISYVRYVPIPGKAPNDANPPYDTHLITAKGFANIDTVKTTRPIDVHDFDINNNGEKLISVYYDTLIDISKLTGNDADIAVLSRVYEIQVLDNHDKVIFEWNPLHYISTDERYVEYKGFGGPKFAEGEYDWNHINSLKWADDGNIIYSFRNIGTGKVNRKTGELMWQLGAKNTGIHLDDRISFFGQHDFQQIKSGPFKGKYSVLSNGNNKHSYFTGNVYDIDEKNLSAKLIHRYYIDSAHHSEGSGNYTWVDNKQIVCYGVRDALPNKNVTRSAFANIADSTNKIMATYYLPASVYAYRVECQSPNNDWPAVLPDRPVIHSEKNYLFVDTRMADQLEWYELVGKEMNPVKLGEGDMFYPKKPGLYIVTRQLALGAIISEPYHYLSK